MNSVEVAQKLAELNKISRISDRVQKRLDLLNQEFDALYGPIADDIEWDDNEGEYVMRTSKSLSKESFLLDARLTRFCNVAPPIQLL